MREVWLIRHGAAEGASPAGDAARRLTNEGKAKLHAIGRVVESWRVRADALWHSPYVRATETAAILAPAFGAPRAQVREDLVPEGPSAAVADEIFQDRSRTLVVVSHLPLLPSVAAILTGARIEMGTGTLVHLAILGGAGAERCAVVLGVHAAERLQGLIPAARG